MQLIFQRKREALNVQQHHINWCSRHALIAYMAGSQWTRLHWYNCDWQCRLQSKMFKCSALFSTI